MQQAAACGAVTGEGRAAQVADIQSLVDEAAAEAGAGPGGDAGGPSQHAGPPPKELRDATSPFQHGAFLRMVEGVELGALLLAPLYLVTVGQVTWATLGAVKAEGRRITAGFTARVMQHAAHLLVTHRAVPLLASCIALPVVEYGLRRLQHPEEVAAAASWTAGLLHRMPASTADLAAARRVRAFVTSAAAAGTPDTMPTPLAATRSGPAPGLRSPSLSGLLEGPAAPVLPHTSHLTAPAGWAHAHGQLSHMIPLLPDLGASFHVMQACLGAIRSTADQAKAPVLLAAQPALLSAEDLPAPQPAVPSSCKTPSAFALALERMGQAITGSQLSQGGVTASAKSAFQDGLALATDAISRQPQQGLLRSWAARSDAVLALPHAAVSAVLADMALDAPLTPLAHDIHCIADPVESAALTLGTARLAIAAEHMQRVGVSRCDRSAVERQPSGSWALRAAVAAEISRWGERSMEDALLRGSGSLLHRLPLAVQCGAVQACDVEGVAFPPVGAEVEASRQLPTPHLMQRTPVPGGMLTLAATASPLDSGQLSRASRLHSSLSAQGVQAHLGSLPRDMAVSLGNLPASLPCSHQLSTALGLAGASGSIPSPQVRATLRAAAKRATAQLQEDFSAVLDGRGAHVAVEDLRHAMASDPHEDVLVDTYNSQLDVAPLSWTNVGWWSCHPVAAVCAAGRCDSALPQPPLSQPSQLESLWQHAVAPFTLRIPGCLPQADEGSRLGAGVAVGGTLSFLYRKHLAGMLRVSQPFAAFMTTGAVALAAATILPPYEHSFAGRQAWEAARSSTQPDLPQAPHPSGHRQSQMV